MVTVIAIVHIIFCLLLIALVLLQDPKSSGTGGGVFGAGGANTVLGATGGATFLTRLTRYSAIVFGITCLVLTFLSRPNTGSVIDSTPANAATPTAPLEQPAAPNGAAQAPAANEAKPAAPANQQPAAPAAPATDKK